MQNKLLNCPFCDKKLKRIKNGYEHKSSQCVLSSFILTDVEIPKWNTRKPMERIVEQLEEYEDNYTQNRSSDDYELGQFSICERVIDMLKGGVDNATN